MKKNEQITGCRFLAISIGLVYLWFGALKFFPQFSPAEDLAKHTISLLTFGLIPPNVSIILLAIWETLIGLFLILNIFRRPIIILALIHLVLTFTPFLFFPKQSFNLPFVFTLLGQYIFKNLVIIGALLVLFKQTSPKRATIQQ
jgi:uncharacterized membrane protein YphA (DoxX/SURF4 family)